MMDRSMSGVALRRDALGRGALRMGSLATAAMIAASGVVFAQQPAPKAPAAAPKGTPATAAAAPAGPPPPPWVKVCEKIPFVQQKDGKEVRDDRQLCLTQHERIDGNTGIVLVSAGIREVEKFDKKYFMVMVPLGMSLQENIRVGVYPKALWEKLEKNEAVDDKEIKPVTIPYVMCHFAGCSGEIELTPDFEKQVKEGAGMVVLVVNGAGVPIGLPVPLTGLAQVQAGTPMSMEAYKTEKAKLLTAIGQRQQQQIEELRKQQGELNGLTGQQPPATGAAPPAKAPAAPAPQKK
jgi:invasion protein IalB